MIETKRILNILTFDLEDWFHILDLPDWQPTVSDWAALPSRVEFGVKQILKLLSDNHVHSTFFVLGWIAERYPQLVKQIDSCGHEIACHGYKHDLIYDLSPKQFREDIHRAKVLIEDIIGKSIMGYRGPGFSITENNLWAFDVIAEEGFCYDATVYPGNHGHGGLPNMPFIPFIIKTVKGYSIVEFPVTVLKLRRYCVAFSGGGYFRIFPYILIKRFITSYNKKGSPVMVYIHPRDIDPHTPRLAMPLKRRFKCYVNISGSYEKMEMLLKNHSFTSIKEWLSSNDNSMSSVSISQLKSVLIN